MCSTNPRIAIAIWLLTLLADDSALAQAPGLPPPITGGATDASVSADDGIPAESGVAAATGDSADKDGPAGSSSLFDLDLEQLSNTDVVVPAFDTTVSTVSRRESTVGRSPAAVFVIDQEMIKRSGARNIPEILRIAPGVHVARIDANKWAISIRGFNQLYSNKLLVQIDGRAVYTPLFAGTYWDEQDVVLEDIERIEVIRGPGATVWGANAVNGVINIFTKSAKDTQGGLVVSGGGDQETMFNTVRYGGQSGDDLHWRVYGKHFARDDGFAPEGAYDAWNQGRAGFRADWTPSDIDVVTVQGDIYDGTSRGTHARYIPVSPFIEQNRVKELISGGNLISRWTRQLDEERNWSLQFYYDRRERASQKIALERDTYDLDYQYNFAFGPYQRITTGAGYRRSEDSTRGYEGLAFDPAARGIDLYSAFIQDELELTEDLWYFTVGAKFEHNDFSGFEFQPSARLLYTPTERQSWWAAISRAVRTPARTDTDVFAKGVIEPGETLQYEYRTSDSLEAEDLLAYELGYRTQPYDELSFDGTVFYNDYENLIDSTFGVPFLSPSGPVVPTSNANGKSARTYGMEIASRFQLKPRWHLMSSYSWIEADVGPKNIVYAQSAWTISPAWEFDANLRYVDSIATLDVPSYITCDLRLAWTPRERLELAVVGQNLFDRTHLQFRDDLDTVSPTEVRRGVYGMLTWRL